MPTGENGYSFLKRLSCQLTHTVLFLIFREISVDGKVTWDIEYKSQKGSSNSSKTAITVVLGDKDYYDKFDVEMYVDQR